MEKVTYKMLNSLNVRVDNSADSERVYDIAANVYTDRVEGMNEEQGDTFVVNRIDGGDVKKKGDVVFMATFSSHGNNNLNINYQNAETEELCKITDAISAFIAEVKTKVQSTPPKTVQ